MCAECAGDLFQCLKGAIKGMLSASRRAQRARFQCLKGAIKGLMTAARAVEDSRFQCLKGVIKGLDLIKKHEGWRDFNASKVRLKADATGKALDALRISMPQRCD